MIDKEEIILMTKLAIHEKQYGKKDEKINAYFKWDYIYINNWYTRFAVVVAIGITVSWVTLTDVYIKEIIPLFDVDLMAYLSKYVLGTVLSILAYTGISTMVYNKKYEETQKRLYECEKLIKQLDRYEQTKQLREEGFNDTVQ